VLGVVCSDQSLLPGGVCNYGYGMGVPLPLIFTRLSRIFALLGLEPVAGRFRRLRSQRFRHQRTALADWFPSAAAAIGQFLPVTNGTPIPTAAIALTPDFAINAVDRAVRPSMYLPSRGSAGQTLFLRSPYIRLCM